jgi:hypothetical protein
MLYVLHEGRACEHEHAAITAYMASDSTYRITTPVALLDSVVPDGRETSSVRSAVCMRAIAIDMADQLVVCDKCLAVDRASFVHTSEKSAFAIGSNVV